MKRPPYQIWTTIYFCINTIPFLTGLLFALVLFEDGELSPRDKLEMSCMFGSLFLLATIPIWRITLGKNTPRNYQKLLFWIILETIYDPVFGIPVWIFWVRNKAQYGDEAAFKIEKQKLEIEQQKKKIKWQKITAPLRKEISLRKGISSLIITHEALKAYENATEKQQQTMVNIGLLALLNRDKTKRVKNFVTNAIDPASAKAPRPTSQPKSAQDRLLELKKLYDNQLITLQEYEAKKAEIIRQL